MTVSVMCYSPTQKKSKAYRWPERLLRGFRHRSYLSLQHRSPLLDWCLRGKLGSHGDMRALRGRHLGRVRRGRRVRMKRSRSWSRRRLVWGGQCRRLLLSGARIIVWGDADTSHGNIVLLMLTVMMHTRRRARVILIVGYISWRRHSSILRRHTVILLGRAVRWYIVSVHVHVHVHVLRVLMVVLRMGRQRRLVPPSGARTRPRSMPMSMMMPMMRRHVARSPSYHHGTAGHIHRRHAARPRMAMRSPSLTLLYALPSHALPSRQMVVTHLAGLGWCRRFRESPSVATPVVVLVANLSDERQREAGGGVRDGRIRYVKSFDSRRRKDLVLGISCRRLVSVYGW